MANTLLTIGMITRESTRVLENELTFTKRIRREYDDKFAVSGAKIGDTLNIRKPPRYVGRVGQALSIEDATETSVPLVLTTQRGVDISFSSADRALRVDDFSKRFIAPALAKVANDIDFDGLQLALQLNNEIGTPGTVPNTALLYLQAGQRLNEEAAPVSGRNAVISPAMEATIVDALKGLFQSGERIKSQYEKGMMGQGLGFDFYMDQNVPTFTTGPLGGTPTVNGGGQSGATVVTQAWTSSAAKRVSKNDVVTFAGCNAVNPQSKQSTGALKQFLITADGSSDGSGNLTISISPSIVLSGPFQNVSAAPTASGAVTVNGAASTTSPRGVIFHPDFAAFACADLPQTGDADKCAVVNDKQLGMSIRMIRAYDINTDRFPTRLDILYGFALIYQELGVRMAS